MYIVCPNLEAAVDQYQKNGANCLIFKGIYKYRVSCFGILLLKCDKIGRKCIDGGHAYAFTSYEYGVGLCQMRR